MDFIVWDIVVLGISHICAYLFHFGLTDILMPYYRNAMFMLLAIDFCVIIILNTYRHVLRRGFWMEFRASLFQLFTLMGTYTFALFATHVSAEYSREVFFLTWIIYFIVSYCVRIFWKFLLQHKNDAQKPSLLILTNIEHLNEVSKKFFNGDYRSYKIKGLAILDCHWIGRNINGIPVCADNDTVLDYICREWVDEVLLDFFDTTVVSQNNLIENISKMGVIVHFVINDSAQTVPTKLMAEKIGEDVALTWGGKLCISC